MKGALLGDADFLDERVINYLESAACQVHRMKQKLPTSFLSYQVDSIEVQDSGFKAGFAQDTNTVVEIQPTQVAYKWRSTLFMGEWWVRSQGVMKW